MRGGSGKKHGHWSKMFLMDDEYGPGSYEEELILAGMSPMSLRSFGSAGAAAREDWKASAKSVKAKNERQQAYLDLLKNAETPIVIATGAAGTGKTFVANAYGIEQLLSGSYKRMVLTRPIVAVDDKNIGALPGTLVAKTAPWLMPIYDVLHKYVSPKEVAAMIERGTIEVVPISMLRGRSFENTYIIADEMQNSTPAQMLMLLTRIGSGSKLVINGDPMQHDRAFEINGLSDVVEKLARAQQRRPGGIGVVEFTEEHVERHPIIRDILRLYHAKSVPTI